MSICEENNWKFMIVHKDGDIPFIHKEFESLLPLTPENHFTFLTGLQGKTRRSTAGSTIYPTPIRRRRNTRSVFWSVWKTS